MDIITITSSVNDLQVNFDPSVEVGEAGQLLRNLGESILDEYISKIANDPQLVLEELSENRFDDDVTASIVVSRDEENLSVKYAPGWQVPEDWKLIQFVNHVSRVMTVVGWSLSLKAATDGNS